MSPAERELARLLARSTLGERLRILDSELQDLIAKDLFAGLDAEDRGELERGLAAAGTRALYAFVTAHVEAVADFAADHPAHALQVDRPTSPARPPRAGDWFRADPAERWHRFSGDLRIRVVGRRTETFAETRCGAAVAIASTDGAAPIESAPTVSRTDACATCRGVAIARRSRIRRSGQPRS